MNKQFSKMVFELIPDEDDHPPVSAESLWGIQKEDSTYEIDNSPYYIYGVSKGDWVLARPKNGELMAINVVRQGGHSTMRVFANDPKKKLLIISKLEELGAKCSSTRELSLFSVDIPRNSDFSKIDEYLSSITDGENIAYEDACIQHEKIEFTRRSECASLASIRIVTH